jgi:hypothetical protein
MRRNEMRRSVLALCLWAAIGGGAALAQSPDHGRAPSDEPAGRIGRLLGDLMGQIDPYWRDLTQMLGDVSGWQPPEILPNGDILIRRRQPVEGGETPEDPPPGSSPRPPLSDPFEL